MTKDYQQGKYSLEAVCKPPAFSSLEMKAADSGAQVCRVESKKALHQCTNVNISFGIFLAYLAIFLSLH